MIFMQVMKHINRLPPELLERIFLMLSFKDRKTAVLVCRSVHNPLLDLICDFDVDDNQGGVDQGSADQGGDADDNQGGGRRWVRCQGFGAGSNLR